MGTIIDPKEFGLDSRTVIEKDDGEGLYIVIDRKSRIIMADGRKLLHKIDQIRKTLPHTSIGIKTSAPVCSKTRAYLEEQGIAIVEM